MFPTEHHYYIFKTIRRKENQEILMNAAPSNSYLKGQLWTKMVSEINAVSFFYFFEVFKHWDIWLSLIFSFFKVTFSKYLRSSIADPILVRIRGSIHLSGSSAEADPANYVSDHKHRNHTDPDLNPGHHVWAPNQRIISWFYPFKLKVLLGLLHFLILSL